MSKHTAADWRVDDVSDAYLIRSRNDALIAIAYDRAEAAHIVRCVNSHDALVEALERAEDVIDMNLATLIDSFKVVGPRVEDAVAHGLVRAESGEWLESDAAEDLEKHERALRNIRATLAAAKGDA